MRRPDLPIVSALACAIVGLNLWSVAAVSDELKVPEQPQAIDAKAVARPTRGMTMEKVEANYGAPTRKVAPVGEPPIERWEYPSFTVYFEYRKVIHSVAIAS